jgi:hypothetical protein
MARDYKREAIAENEAQSAGFRWIQARVDAIRKNVSAHDVLRRNGIKLHYNIDREEQFACPFHGVDRHPSARVYPETVKGPSHVWCFVCRENWDSIALWKKFSGGEVKFTRTLTEIERTFGILPPERPPTAEEMVDYVDPEILAIDDMFDTCESRLRHSRKEMDMKSHLILGSILDRVRYQFENGALPSAKVKALLQQVLEKIGSKIRNTTPAA